MLDIVIATGSASGNVSNDQIKRLTVAREQIDLMKDLIKKERERQQAIENGSLE